MRYTTFALLAAVALAQDIPASLSVPSYQPSGAFSANGFVVPSAIIPPQGASSSEAASSAFVLPTGISTALSCGEAQCTPSSPAVQFCHDPTGQIYTLNCALRFTGSTFGPASNVSSLAGCEELCDVQEGCQAVNYVFNATSCSLISRVNGTAFEPGVVGAWHGYWATNGAQSGSNSTALGSSFGSGSSFAPSSGAVPGGNFAPGNSTASGNNSSASNATVSATSEILSVTSLSSLADPVSTEVVSSTAALNTLSSSLSGAAVISAAPSPSANSSGIVVDPSIGGTINVGTGLLPTLTSLLGNSGVALPTGVSPTGGLPFPSGIASAFPTCSETACSDDSAKICQDVNGQVYTLNCGMRFQGTVGLALPISTLSQCESQCDTLPRCLAFNYGNETCQFMYTVTGIEFPAPGWTGGWRGVWMGGAPTVSGNSTGGFPGAGNSTGGFPVPGNSTGGFPFPTNTTGGFPSLGPDPSNSTISTNGTVTDPATNVTDPLSASQSIAASSLIISVEPSSTIPSLSLSTAAGTSGFPSISANSSNLQAGPTGTAPGGFATGVIPTGSFPTGSFPTGSFPTFSGPSTNATFPSCATASCAASGVAYCTDARGQVYTLNCGLKFLGDVSSSLTTDDISECEAACDTAPRCLGFNFDGEVCDFIATVSGIDMPAPGYTGVWRGFWANGGGAPPALNGSVPTNGTAPTNVTAPANETSAAASSLPSTSPASSIADPIETTVLASSSSVVAISTASASGSIVSGSPIPSGLPANATSPTSPQNGTHISCSADFVCAAPYQTSFCQDDAGQLYTRTCGIAFLGAPLPAVDDSLDCEAGCDAQPACIAANDDGETCTYLSSVMGTMPKEGTVALWKGMWFGGAPTGAPTTGGNSTFGPPSFNGTEPVFAPSNETVSANATTSAFATGSSSPISASDPTVSPFTTLSASSALASTSLDALSAAPVTASSAPVLTSSTAPVALSTGTPSQPPQNATRPACDATICVPGFCDDVNGQVYTINCGTQFLGPSLDNARVREVDDGTPLAGRSAERVPPSLSLTRDVTDASSLEDCQAACDEMSSCVALNFGNGCALLSGIYGVARVSGVIGAYRGVWITGSSAPSTNGTQGGSPAFPAFPAGPTAPIPSQNATVSTPAEGVIVSSSSVLVPVTTSSSLSPEISSLLSSTAPVTIADPISTSEQGSATPIVDPTSSSSAVSSSVTSAPSSSADPGSGSAAGPAFSSRPAAPGRPSSAPFFSGRPFPAFSSPAQASPTALSTVSASPSVSSASDPASSSASSSSASSSSASSSSASSSSASSSSASSSSASSSSASSSSASSSSASATSLPLVADPVTTTSPSAESSSVAARPTTLQTHTSSTQAPSTPAPVPSQPKTEPKPVPEQPKQQGPPAGSSNGAPAQGGQSFAKPGQSYGFPAGRPGQSFGPPGGRPGQSLGPSGGRPGESFGPPNGAEGQFHGPPSRGPSNGSWFDGFRSWFGNSRNGPPSRYAGGEGRPW